MNGSATPTWLDHLPAPPLFYVLHPDTPEQDAQPGRTDRDYQNHRRGGLTSGRL